MLRKIVFFLFFLSSVVLGASNDHRTHSEEVGEIFSHQGEKTHSTTPTKGHRLLQLHWKEGGVEVQFDTAVDPTEMHLSKIVEPDKNRFRYILDIANASSTSQALVSSANHKIRLSPYKQKMVRMVIEYHEAMVIQPRTEGGNVYIDLALPSQGVPFSPITPQPLVDPTPPSAIPKSTPVVVPPTDPIATPLPIDPSSIPLPANEEGAVEEKKAKIIVIDPGHGGKDNGAIGNGVIEKEIVLQMGLQLSQQLQALGYTVYMTRSDDTFIELKERTQLANDKRADLFLSIHANSIPKTSNPLATRGVETYYLSPGRSERAKGVAAFENAAAMSEMGEFGKMSFLNVLNSEKILASHKLAIDIQKGVFGILQKYYTNIKNNGAREAPFWVLVGAQMPAILLETGYISHPEESSRLADPSYQRVIVQGMVEGVVHYFANNP